MLYTLRHTLVLALSTICVLAGIKPAVDWESYEHGDLGLFPQVDFKTTEVQAPLIHITKHSPACDSTSYTLLTPHGDPVRNNVAYLVDSEGDIVWYQQERGVIQSFQVQTYKGSQYLSYWVGDADHFGHGHGYYKMVRAMLKYR